MFYHFFATLLENCNSSSCFEGLYGNLIHVLLDCFIALDWFFLFVSRERQSRKARERKPRKQTKLKSNVSSAAVLNDDSNTFDIFNEW